MTAGLMKPGDLRTRLGMSTTAFYTFQKRGDFKRLEVRHPVGVYRYSTELVEAFLAGKTVAAHGRRVTQ